MAPSGLSLEAWIVILIAIIAANLPFVSDRFLFAKALAYKGVSWCLLELLFLYVVIGILAYGLENAIGNVFPKRWEFFAVTLCLFLVAAFPGFIWKFLLKRKLHLSHDD